MLEPVLKESPKRTNPNSPDPKRIRSSDSRDRCVPTSASANRVSATKSRSATASMLLGDTAVNPRRSRSSSRGTGKALPATAPLPNGSVAADRAAAARRRRSRSSGQKCESIQCAPLTGCARCRWVYAGRMTSCNRRACATMTCCSSRSAAASRPQASMVQSRVAVATWSLRLRPVWRRDAGSPTSSWRSRSISVWMSSSDAAGVTPAASRRPTAASPSASTRLSSSGTTPAAPNASAHACDSRMSNRQRRKSTPMDRLTCSSRGLGPPENRPPQSLCAGAVGVPSAASVTARSRWLATLVRRRPAAGP